MPNLFDSIPTGFFNCLASGSNKRIYADCLQIIYEVCDREISYRVPKNQVRDALALYLLDTHAKFESEDSVDIKNHNDMAGAILRKLSDKDTGWLEEETDDATYDKYIVMTDLGIQLARFLSTLKTPERIEYSSYIYNIYSTLNGLQTDPLLRENPYANVLLVVNREAHSLSDALKSLDTSIRKIIEHTMEEETFESLTNHLIEYFDGSFIKEYARLMKQQNIHIYSNPIKSNLEKLQSDPDIFNLLIEKCMEEDNISKIEAQDKVQTLIDSAKSFLTSKYDTIMSDIQSKINAYLSIAVARLRFIHSRGTDIKSSVERVIKYIAEEMQDVGMRDEMPANINSLFLLDKYEFVDTVSLRFPSKQRVIKNATACDIEEATQEQITEARRQQLREAYNPYSKEKMKIYTEFLLNGQDSVSTSQIPLTSKTDILSTLSAIAYGEENGYSVAPSDEYTETNDLLIRSFTIKRGGNRDAGFLGQLHVI